MLTRAFYLSRLYLDSDKSPLIVAVLCLLLAVGLLHAVYAKRKIIRYAVVYALLHAAIYFGIVKLSEGAWSFMLFRLCSVFVEETADALLASSFQGLVFGFGLPAALHGLLASILLLWLIKKLFPRKTARKLTGR